ncbi:PhzF family phenazine biosynthesis protein [Gilvimarinus sp. SDUM040013]|uniref:PhzF family phenazine biosynthesis protein n=1 Tax=Gilvimarinus gilvus TaxID=3058038 RepID=A0ABU4RYU3_9GAMM|nr:PhzF family phenazine biosynthesis protein [Gilvimarinus sp. SDUM040013]MDO3386294.1 PhzF family phenazine biosynthesis protein [Gilvimarinus sp. SDUM040013]MDX6850048.1 PhzF family phenazine biosynthesis protein [Gilvimarinus sp. SDUM040013]
MFTDSIELQVFGSELNLGGNRHRVAFSQNALPRNWDKPGKWVLARQEASQLQVRHFDNGQLVRRCGSGSLALAAALYLASAHYYERRVLSDSGSILIGFDRQGPYYKERPLHQRPTKQHLLWSHLCSEPLQACTFIGSQREYCLAHLETYSDINAVRLRARALTLLSQRALILLAGSPPSLQMRYFAPQYGITEDSATGSAAVQVARYFWQHLGSRRLSILQGTRDSSIIYTEINPNRLITIRGHWHLNP